MMAIVRLRTTHEHIKTCLKQFSEMPQVIEVLRLTGEDCFHLKVIVPTPAEPGRHCRCGCSLWFGHYGDRSAQRAGQAYWT